MAFLPPNPMDFENGQPNFADVLQAGLKVQPPPTPTNTITRKLWFPFFTAFRNPGKFEQLQRESAALDMLELFDGVNFTLGRLASQTFSLSHNLQLPTESQHNYLLAADHQYNQNVSLGAQWFSNGRVGGSVRYAGDPIRANYQVSFDGASPNHSLDVDYYGPDCTASLKVTTAMGWILHAAYSQAITKDLALGVQLEGFFKPAEFGISWNGRYETPDWVFSGLFRYGSHGLFSVSRKIARGVTATSQLVVQQDPNTNSLVSSGLFGVEYQFQASRFKGTIDSRGVIRSVFEESIAEVMTITLCNELIFPAKKFRLGFGFSITL